MALPAATWVASRANESLNPDIASSSGTISVCVFSKLLAVRRRSVSLNKETAEDWGNCTILELLLSERPLFVGGYMSFDDVLLNVEGAVPSSSKDMGVWNEPEW